MRFGPDVGKLPSEVLGVLFLSLVCRAFGNVEVEEEGRERSCV